MPRLENWGGGLKSLTWHANSPHTPSVQTLQQTTTKILYRDGRKKYILKKKIYIYIYIERERESVEKNIYKYEEKLTTHTPTSHYVSSISDGFTCLFHNEASLLFGLFV